MQPWVLPIAAGPFVGSFLGVLIRRLPEGRPVAAARSACETCGHTLSPFEMVPLLSYAAQRGRCRHCAAPIAPAHPAFELAALGVAVIAALVVPGMAALWSSCVLGWWLLALGWIDAENYILPDVLTLPLILAGLAQAWFFARDAVTDRAEACALAAAVLIGIAYGYRRLRHRDGLGMGDAKLLAAGGAWVGLIATPWIMIFGGMLGLLYALVLRLSGRPLTRTTAIPFGPFLAAGIWMAWLLLWRRGVP